MADTSMLKFINNPYSRDYTITHFVPEVTFEGGDKKPDFGEVTIKYTPTHNLIELKSLKYYMYQFRDKLRSYERIVNEIYDDLDNVYSPIELVVTLETNPRGGISSKLVVGNGI